MGLYVYAIGLSDHRAMPALQGILDQPVFRIEDDDLCAFVSDCADHSVRAERRHLAATQRTLAALSACFDMLPMAFGTMASSHDDVRELLRAHQERLRTQLNRISGAIEMSLRVNLDVPDPIAYLVQRTPSLRAARERTFGGGRRPPSHDSKLRLGRIVDEAIREFKNARVGEIMALLSPACSELISLPVREDREVANLAALVPRCGVEQFEAAVYAAAARMDEELAINIGGPWPPHNFVEGGIAS